MHYKEDSRLEVTKNAVYWSDQHVGNMIKEIMEKIDIIMNEKKISYHNLAEMTGISVAYLYRIIKGEHPKVGISYVYKIIKALDLDPDIIIPDELKKRKKKEEYGEFFEYTIRNLKDSEKDLLMKWVELYVNHQEKEKFTYQQTKKEEE